MIGATDQLLLTTRQILECGGNLFDAVSLAVKAALFTAVIPNVSVTNVDGGEPELEVRFLGPDIVLFCRERLFARGGAEAKSFEPLRHGEKNKPRSKDPLGRLGNLLKTYSIDR